MTNKITASGGQLPTMQCHFEGTPALVALAKADFIAAGCTVIDADAHYQGKGYTACRTDCDYEMADRICRAHDDREYAAKSGKSVRWGYVGPMTATANVETKRVAELIAAINKLGYLVDKANTRGAWTTFNTNIDGKTFNKLVVVAEITASLNHLAGGRFGDR